MRVMLSEAKHLTYEAWDTLKTRNVPSACVGFFTSFGMT